MQEHADSSLFRKSFCRWEWNQTTHRLFFFSLSLPMMQVIGQRRSGKYYTPFHAASTGPLPAVLGRGPLIFYGGVHFPALNDIFMPF